MPEKLPGIPLHGLRHTSASVTLAESIDPVAVSERLEHAQVSTTLNIYGHAMIEQVRASGKAFGDALRRGSSGN